MRAILRGMTAWGALVLAPSIAAAQNVAEPPPAQAPAPDAIGPRELQNFSLPGTTTQPAEQPATPTAPATTSPPPAASEAARPASEPRLRTETSKPVPAHTLKAPPPTASAPQPAVPTAQQQAPLPQPAFGAPPPAAPATVAPAPVAEPEHRPAILPWLLAALALGAATAFFLWRRRPREAFAGAPEPELLRVPEPVSAPPPPPRATAQSSEAPPAPRRAAPARSGVVATGLRPSLEIGIEPLRCVIADDQVEIEFAIDLYNAGTAPARAVLAEASMLYAGATQEQELAGFFANPVGAGQRLDAIQPMSRVQLTSKVVAPRAAVQEYELAGRKAFVPVIAFNALYEWSGRKGQTSAAYLIGRETRGDKLGPLRLDSGPHEVRGLAALALPTAVRT
jgi:hypothetical protein